MFIVKYLWAALMGLACVRVISDGIAGFTTNAAIVVDNLLGSNAENIIGRKYTLVSGQTVVRGTVLGKITTGGKMTKSLTASSDGSQAVFGIAAHDVDASGGDKDIIVYEAGNFNENALVLGTGWTVAAVRAAFLATGRIILETPVKHYP